jgi:prepilin peptidase CpaA
MLSGEIARAVVGLGLLTLLAHVAWTDLRYRRISNRACGAILALWPLHLALTAQLLAPLLSLAVGLAVLTVAIVLWQRRLLGGGDVKLLAAVAVWAGPSEVLGFLLVTTLAGGLLALAWLWYRRIGWAVLTPIQAAVAGLLPATCTASGSALAATLPYGVAIAAGGCWLWLRLFAT